jgi:hypothetical protein
VNGRGDFEIIRPEQFLANPKHFFQHGLGFGELAFVIPEVTDRGQAGGRVEVFFPQEFAAGSQRCLQ